MHTERVRIEMECVESVIEWKNGNLARENLINDTLWSASHFPNFMCVIYEIY